MNIKKMISGLLLCAIISFMIAPEALAKSSYLGSFNTQYGTSGSRIDTCGLCHINSGGGGTLNPYGNAYSNGHNFISIQNIDSDGDGFTNIAEINARTFPGNAMDIPVIDPAPTPVITETPLLVPVIPSIPGQAPNMNPVKMVLIVDNMTIIIYN